MVEICSLAICTFSHFIDMYHQKVKEVSCHTSVCNTNGYLIMLVCQNTVEDNFVLGKHRKVVYIEDFFTTFLLSFKANPSQF